MDIPYKLRFLICLLLLGFILTAIGFIVFAKQTASGYKRIDILTLNYTGGNSLIGTNIPFYPKVYVLGALMEKIIFCESSNNLFAVNLKSGAKGLLQIIPSSEKFCEKGLGRELDMFDKEDNLDCGEYLFEHGGLSHWEESYKCWQK